MSAKDKKVFSYFRKVKGEFLDRSHTFSSKKGFLNAFCICSNANVRMMFERTHERSKHICVLGSLHVSPRQCCQLELPRLQQAKHAMSAKHMVS